MADITLGNLITLLFTELAESIEQAGDRADLLKLQLSDIDLDIPAYVRLQTDQSDSTDEQRLIVTMPSTRETPRIGRLGRIRISIEPQQRAPEEPK
jgi:hypothetical protein